MRLLIFFFFMLTAGWLKAQNSLYDLSFVSSTGSTINMSDYRGKILFIAVASPTAIQAKPASLYLGALQSGYPGISILILPSNIGADSSAPLDTDAASYPVLSNTRFSKTLNCRKGTDQHPVLQWLTQSKNNGHFEKDISDDGQFYIINQSGVLCAELDKTVSADFLKTVLSGLANNP